MQNGLKSRVVVAGQTPPPVGGQAIMIARLLDELAQVPDIDSAHLPFHFTRDPGQARRFRFAKVAELCAVLWRLLRLRLRGKIHLLVYPIGGPQFVPVVRDILLLPFMRLTASRLAIHFHAGGVAEALPHLPPLLRWLLTNAASRADDGIVMTEFGRRDPDSLGIKSVHVVAHTMADAFEPSLLQRKRDALPRLLYVGHLSEEKGTRALLEAVARLRRDGLACRLALMGECIAPYTAAHLAADIRRLQLDAVVERLGVLSGRAKWEGFARADLFVFPSLAPESFGLVMVEAMMWGLPVVATDWRGAREVFHGSTGAICFDPAPALVNALTTALRDALQQRESWSQWGAANRRTFESYFDAAKFPCRLGKAVAELARTGPPKVG